MNAIKKKELKKEIKNSLTNISKKHNVPELTKSHYPGSLIIRFEHDLSRVRNMTERLRGLLL